MDGQHHHGLSRTLGGGKGRWMGSRTFMGGGKGRWMDSIKDFHGRREG